jgi:hypothetical protein
MLFMNEYDVADAKRRYAEHPVLGPATTTLANLVEWTNANSDGWPYWSKPCRAAKALQRLIQGDPPTSWRDDERVDATPEKLRLALRPIKSFRTRHGASFDIVEPTS